MLEVFIIWKKELFNSIEHKNIRRFLTFLSYTIVKDIHFFNIFAWWNHWGDWDKKWIGFYYHENCNGKFADDDFHIILYKAYLRLLSIKNVGYGRTNKIPYKNKYNIIWKVNTSAIVVLFMDRSSIIVLYDYHVFIIYVTK